MTRLDRLQRAEFINALQRIYAGLLSRQELQSSTLIEAIFSSPFTLDNSKDIGRLVSQLEYTIDNTLQPELYDYLTSGIKELTSLGASHTVRNTLNIMGDTAFDFLSLDDRLALDYINRVGFDGLVLSDRVWGANDKKSIMKEVYEAIQNNETKYDLAKRLEEVLAIGTPKSSIKRIAETELSRAYTRAKADILASELDLFPNAQGYVEVKLSPAHNVYDICDFLQGTYALEQAPLPPFHPNCLCITRMFMKPTSMGGRVRTLDSSIRDYKTYKKGHIKQIETLNKVVNI